MSILIDATSTVLVQGFTGDKATFHAQEMIAYGTKIVGGVTPGKGGTRHLDRPVFDTVKDAVRETGATTSIVFVPPTFAEPLRTRFRVTVAGGDTAIVIVKEASLIQFAGIEPRAAHVAPKAIALKVTCPRGSPLMGTTIIDPAGASIAPPER